MKIHALRVDITNTVMNFIGMERIAYKKNYGCN